MHWSIDRRMGVGFGLALLILVVTGVGQYLSTTQLVITSRGVAHSLEVTRVLESVGGDLEAVESDVHGYLLTGNRRFLDESRATASEVRYVFRQLRHLMTDDPAQRRRLDQLERLIAAKMSWIEQLVASYQRNGPRVAAALVRSDRGEDLMERTVRLIDVMAAEEAELLGVREEQARARAQTTLLVLLAGSVVAVALVGSALWMIRRDLAGRRRAEAALRHNEASLQAILDHTAVT